MSEVKGNKKSRRPRRRRPQYQHHPFATSVTIYSPDGSPVPVHVLEQVENFIGMIALENKLLTAVNRASS